MLAEAWYGVIEYHVHLGQYKKNAPNDSIEKAVIEISNIIDMLGRTSHQMS